MKCRLPGPQLPATAVRVPVNEASPWAAKAPASSWRTHPLDRAFGNVVRDQVESITNDAVTMLDARALQRLNDDLCGLLAHGVTPCCGPFRPQHARYREVGLAGDCEDLYATAPTTIKWGAVASPLYFSAGCRLCGGDTSALELTRCLGAGLKAGEDLPGALVNRRCGSVRRAIQSRADVPIGLWRARLQQQELGQIRCGL